jgi:hypothetical protein
MLHSTARFASATLPANTRDFTVLRIQHHLRSDLASQAYSARRDGACGNDGDVGCEAGFGPKPESAIHLWRLC